VTAGRDKYDKSSSALVRLPSPGWAQLLTRSPGLKDFLGRGGAGEGFGGSSLKTVPEGMGAQVKDELQGGLGAPGDKVHLPALGLEGLAR